MRRRELLKWTAGATVMAGLPVALVLRGPETFAGSASGEYTETYQGREIRVTTVSGEDAVFVDGRRLHLMKFADDAYLSSMCHYRMAPNPLDAARTAVRELRGADLLPIGHAGHN